MRTPVLRALSIVALATLGVAWAFTWTPFAFPSGDQHYVLELRQGEDADAAVSVIDLQIRDVGGSYDVVTTLTLEQRGVSGDDLATAAFGGDAVGMLMFGPMVAYGPSFFILPMILGEEEVRVRAEPMRVMGMGSVTMDREVEVAGHTCVVVTYTPDGDPSGVVEFALAENLPFPCYSVYGTGSDRIEVRLLRAE